MEKSRGELKRREEFLLIEAHLPVQAPPEAPQKLSFTRKDLPPTSQGDQVGWKICISQID